VNRPGEKDFKKCSSEMRTSFTVAPAPNITIQSAGSCLWVWVSVGRSRCTVHVLEFEIQGSGFRVYRVISTIVF